MKPHTSRDSLKRSAEGASVALLYAITGKLGFLMAMSPGNVTALWPPSGIALAAVLLLGDGVWPWIWLGSFLLNAWFFSGRADSLSAAALAVSGGIAAGSTFQAVLGARLIRRWISPRTLVDHPEDVFRFVGIEALACMLASTIGVGCLALGGFLPWASFVPAWRIWWLGDAAGAVIVTPLLLVLSRRPAPRWEARRALEAVLLAAVLMYSSRSVFVSGGSASLFILPYSLFPILLWAAFRFGQSGVALATAAVSLTAVWGTAHALGPFTQDALPESIARLQTFVSVFVVTGLVLASALAQYQRTQKELTEALGDLEGRVRERTAELLLSEAALKRKTEELARSNAELETFATTASHDLQEPLRKIIAFSDLIKKRCAANLDDVGRDFLSRMQTSAQRMTKLITDLLQLSRVVRDSRPFEVVDLNAVVGEVLADLEPRVAESNAAIEVGRLPALRAHPFQMRQLFQNLIGNALKFRSKSGTPRIAIAGRSQADGFIEISVADNGIGFEEQYSEKVFEPFTRLHTRAEYDGSGIGLAICRKIMLRHGGWISAHSTPGKGSVFTMKLPSPPERL